MDYTWNRCVASIPPLRALNGLNGSAMAANADTEVGQRIVSQEPMYLIVNLGLSENFGAIE